MSLAITIISPEGIVLAADSRLTVTMKNELADGSKTVIPNYYDNAVKVLNLTKPHNYVAATTYGAGTIGQRTAHSYLKEFQASLGNRRLATKTFAQKLLDFYKKQWGEVEHSEDEDKLYFQVAGIDATELYGEAYLVTIPDSTSPHTLIEKGSFSLAWGGQTDTVYRLAKGYDALIAQELNDSNLSEEDKQMVLQILNSKELNLPIHLYSLQDCIDLARFLIDSTVKAQSLSVGIRGVGGSIDVGCITRHKDFWFIARKELK
ncbi:MAG TPA: hypothetical protein VL989_01395 [Candidatus Sulfotelmatobacter sp.]|nr:hypothetical protein [Candidatus Sulfotelmatobacter sp.]